MMNKFQTDCDDDNDALKNKKTLVKQTSFINRVHVYLILKSWFITGDSLFVDGNIFHAHSNSFLIHAAWYS